MRKYKPKHLKRGSMIGIIVLSFLLGTLPVLVHEVQNPPTNQVQAATLALKQFPGLDWTTPSQENVSVLLGEKTDKERLVLATGQKSSAISTTDISVDIYNFYDKDIKLKGFSRDSLVRDPENSKYWVAHYHKGQEYAEVEYYPTPYKTDSFTIVLFFGVLPKGT